MDNTRIVGQESNRQFVPLYIIILNWNLAEETIACVESLQRSEDLSGVKIVVVDNGSTDHSVDLLTRHFGNSIEVIQNSANLGFAAGINVGIRHALSAGARSVFLLNNDTLVDPAMISKLLAAARHIPPAGILGPAIYYHQAPTRIWRCGDKEFAWLPIPVKVSQQEMLKKFPMPFKLDYVTGCAMFIKREVLDAIGLFDSRYFMYFEDADFCRRARQANFEIWCVPEAKMWHKVSLSAQKDKPATRYARSWGRVQFYQRHPHGRYPKLIFLYLIVKLLTTTLLDILHADWGLIKPLWLGTLNGYKNQPTID